MYHFEAAYPLLFRKTDLLNILVSEGRLRHRYLHNKDNIMRGFDTIDIVLVSNKEKSIRKYGALQKLVFLKRDPIEFWIRLYKAHIGFSI